MNTYVQTNAPAAPAATSPASALQGTFTSVWQLPVNALSTSFGYLTDSNTAEATANGNQGYANDNTSVNVLGSFSNIFQAVQTASTAPQGGALEVPTAELTAATNGGSTLTAAKMTAVSPDDFGQGSTATFTTNVGATNATNTMNDTAGTTAVITNATADILFDPTDAGIQSYMTGFVDGMQWFRGQFAWMAQILGWLLELFCLMKCWELIQWGLNGGPFPLDISLKRPTPKHDTVSDPAGRDSPLNAADNYGRVQQEIGNKPTGTESMAASAARSGLEAGAIRAGEIAAEVGTEALLL